ncbi:hypothetical protein [Desulfoluna butyratoxydans]|uniref:Uncharacterized protein n=1 Tax=Desulfoluna butyratoxydans TaxID=231438 RepID=A0A4U8YTM0_9BACT|nr:hypothetical protein [Desulfoluna butyratoxydans]VFQ46719.1 hypothetical protein MSL71_43890 [Desulfoluna butyratoxydans]
MKHVILIILVSVCLTACCMKSLKVRPEMNALDMKNANIGVMKADIEFDFSECCPSKDEEKIALNIKKKSEELCTQLVAGDISIEAYNSKIESIHKALYMVVYACAASTGRDINDLSKPHFTIPTVSVQEAWEHLEQIDQIIE